MRAIVVTGANKGIGFGIVERLASSTPHNAEIVLCSRDPALGETALAKLRESHPSARVVLFAPLEITEQQHVDALAVFLRTRYQNGVLSLVNNAGFAFKGDTFGHKEAQFTVNVNYYGTRRVTEAVLPLLCERATIVNVSSSASTLSRCSPAVRDRWLSARTVDDITKLTDEFIAAIAAKDWKEKGWPTSMYSVSKMAMTAYSRVLAADTRVTSRQIRVNSCCPGYCATDMSSGRGEISAYEGADTPTMLALLPPEDTASSGGFYRRRELWKWENV